MNLEIISIISWCLYGADDTDSQEYLTGGKIEASPARVHFHRLWLLNCAFSFALFVFPPVEAFPFNPH